MLVNYIYDYQYFKLPIMLLIDLNKLQDQWLSALFKKKKVTCYAKCLNFFEKVNLNIHVYGRCLHPISYQTMVSQSLLRWQFLGHCLTMSHEFHAIRKSIINLNILIPVHSVLQNKKKG